MRTRLVTERAATTRTFVLALAPGDEVMSSLHEFAREHDVTGASFTGLGAVSSCVAAFFDRERRAYDELVFDEQLEVLSLVGNLSVFEDAPRVHAHIMLGYPDGSVRGGHLVSAEVWPTLEVSVVVHDVTLTREVDPISTLPLLVP